MKVVSNHSRPHRRLHIGLCAGIAATLFLLVAPRAHAGNVTWTLAGAGYWDTAANWSSNPSLPGPADTVTNNTTYTITHNDGDDVISSLTSSGELALTGGTLDVTGNMQVNNELYIDGGTLSDATLLQGTGGSLVMAPSGNNTLNNVKLYGGLDLSTVATGQTYAGSAHLTGGTTFGANPTILLGAGGSLSFDNDTSETLSGATINFTCATIYDTNLYIEGGETLTIASNSTITGTQAYIGGSHYDTPGESTLINNGTITVKTVGYQGYETTVMMDIGDSGILSNLVNGSGGVISAPSGTLTIDPARFTNQGKVVSTGGTVYITPADPWQPSGSIEADTYTNAVVQLGGTYTLPTNVSSILATKGANANSSGYIALSGNIDLTGDVEGALTNFDPTTDIGGTGKSYVNGAVFYGGGVGTITHSYEMLIGGATFNDIALDSGLNLATLSPSSVNGFAGSATLKGGTTLGANPTIALGSDSTLDIDNGKSETLNGATINFNLPTGDYAAAILIDGGETITLGPTTTVTGLNGSFGGAWAQSSGSSTLINEGTITETASSPSLAGPTSSMQIGESATYGARLTNFTNAAGGSIDAPGYLSLIRVDPTNFTNAGNITASAGGIVSIEPSNPWMPSGAITATGSTTSNGATYVSTVNLGGTFSLPANAAAVLSTSNGGWIEVGRFWVAYNSGYGGTMDLTGDVPGSLTTFDPTTDVGGTANFGINGGTINGGSIAHSSSLFFFHNPYVTQNSSSNALSYSNTLNGVSLDGGLDLSKTDPISGETGWAHLTGGTTFGPHPTITLGIDSVLSIDNARQDTLYGATINLPGNSVNQFGGIALENGETLILDSATVVNGTGGYIGGIEYGGTGYKGPTLVNNGMIAGNLTLGQQPDQNLEYPYAIASVVNNSGGTINGSITINPTNFTNYGTVLATNGNSTTISPATLINAGEILATSGGNIGVSPTNPFTNTGTIDAEAGSEVYLSSGFTQAAGQIVANGTVEQNIGTMTITGGTVTGSGTLNVNHVVNNGGTISPGSPIGTLSITGNYTQGVNGTVAFDIGGTQAGTDYSVLAVGTSSGTATLGGAIYVDFVNGFVPTPGETFEVMTYSSVTGNFNFVESANYDNIQVEIFPTYAEIVVTPGPDSLLVLAGGLGVIPLALRRKRLSDRRGRI